jgi:hypothetical protein
MNTTHARTVMTVPMLPVHVNVVAYALRGERNFHHGQLVRHSTKRDSAARETIKYCQDQG